MKRRTVIGVQPPSPEEMAWLDKQAIDPMNVEQVGLLAQILHVNMSRISDAIAAAGPKVRDTAWGVRFIGSSEVGNKTFTRFAWCVRGGQGVDPQ
jgi:hypothetical protein